MRFLLSLLAVAPLAAQTPHTLRGPTPEAVAWARFAAQSKQALASLEGAPSDSLPPAPEGVTDLAFTEFFGPIGDRGLEFSDKLRGLAGRRVRLMGHMVREGDRAPGLFRFAGWPVMVETKGLCTSDDTPPSIVYIVVPGLEAQLAPWRPGRLALIGTLEIGARAELDGRNSFVRLVLDADSAGLFRPLAPAAVPAATPTP